MWNELKLRPSVSIPFSGSAGTTVIIAGPAILVGWALRETASNSVSVDMVDGTGSGGSAAQSFVVPANGSVIATVGTEGVLVRGGLVVTLSGTGSLKGAFTLRL